MWLVFLMEHQPPAETKKGINHMDNITGIIIASDYRGNYILKNGWVYNQASNGYGNCIIGEFSHFMKCYTNNINDFNITPTGKEVIEAYNSCKKACKCSKCKKYYKDVLCLIRHI